MTFLYARPPNAWWRPVSRGRSTPFSRPISSGTSPIPTPSSRRCATYWRRRTPGGARVHPQRPSRPPRRVDGGVPRHGPARRRPPRRRGPVPPSVAQRPGVRHRARLRRPVSAPPASKTSGCCPCRDGRPASRTPSSPAGRPADRGTADEGSAARRPDEARQGPAGPQTGRRPGRPALHGRPPPDHRRRRGRHRRTRGRDGPRRTRHAGHPLRTGASPRRTPGRLADRSVGRHRPSP